MRDPIIAPPIPPAGAKQVGTHTDGRAIYEMEVRVKDGIQAAVRDGKEVWVKNPATGEPLRQVYETVYKVERKRFVIEQMPNGTNFLNFHFEESAEVKAQREREQKKRQFMERLVDRAIDEGVSPDALFAALQGGGRAEDEEDGEDSPYPRRKRGGWWEFSDGSNRRVSTEEEARRIQAELDREAAALSTAAA